MMKTSTPKNRFRIALLITLGALFLLLLLLLMNADSSWTATVTETIGLSDSRDAQNKTQEDRKLRIAETCRALNPALPHMNQTYSRLLVDDEHNLLYCFIPKTGTTSWKFLLLNLTQGNLTLSGSISKTGTDFTAHKYVHSSESLQRLSEYSPAERNFRLRTYFKFLVVRNPLDRLVSAYRDKFESGVHNGHFRRRAAQIMKDIKPADKNMNITFQDFITCIKIYKNMHWELYERLCQPCFINYDYVAKFETMDEDSQTILKHLGLGDVQLPKLHTQHRVDYHQYLQQLDSEHLRSVADYVATDAKMFGYD